jgi:hypothetical protein
MSYPIQFYQSAKRDVDEYIKENEYNNVDLDEYKELMLETLFNDCISFYTVSDCIEFIDNKAKDIFKMVDYIETEGEEVPKDLIQQFNLCLYLVGRNIIDKLTIDDLTNESDSEESDNE